MENKHYNGWSNYETWRVNLEFFDGITEELDAAECEELVLSYIDECGTSDMLAGWLSCFLANVNWDEISKYLIEI